MSLFVHLEMVEWLITNCLVSLNPVSEILIRITCYYRKTKMDELKKVHPSVVFQFK